MTKPAPINVIGGGGHAKVVVQAICAAGGRVAAIFDDNRSTWGKNILSVPVGGPVARIADEPRRPAVIAVGDNRARQAIAEQFDLDWITVVHPLAHVDLSVKLGRGTVVLPGAIVQVDSILGIHCIINTGATVDHDCAIGDFSHIAPGANLAGGVVVGKGVLLGIGSAAIPGVKIGDNSVVGAGAAVVDDIPVNSLAVGVPAKCKRIIINRNN